MPGLGVGSPVGIGGVRQAAELLASATREVGWDEAKRMIVAVGAMGDAAFQRWHVQTLATLTETLEPTASVKTATGRLTRRLPDR